MVFCEQKKSFMEALKTLRRMHLPACQAGLPPWNVIGSGIIPVPSRTPSPRRKTKSPQALMLPITG